MSGFPPEARARRPPGGRSRGVAQEPEPEVQGQGPEKGAKGGKGAGKSANGKGVEKGKGPDKGKGKNGKGPGRICLNSWFPASSIALTCSKRPPEDC